jgi:ATP-dependent DNA helicase 2 subunit 2
MAGKEATVYILDLGNSMSEKRYGRNQTDLDWALEYVWDKITNTVSRRSFGDLVRIMSRREICMKYLCTCMCAFAWALTK